MFLGTNVHYSEWTVVIVQKFGCYFFFLNSRLGIVVCTKYLEKQKWWVFIGIARVIVWRKSIQWLYIKNKRKKPTRGSCTFQFLRLIVWIRTSQTKLIFTVATSKPGVLVYSDQLVQNSSTKFRLCEQWQHMKKKRNSNYWRWRCRRKWLRMTHILYIHIKVRRSPRTPSIQYSEHM